MWSHSKIEAKKTRLEAIRAQLLFDIVVPIAGRVNTIPDKAAIDTQTRTLLGEIRAGADASDAMEKRLRAFHEEYAAVQDKRHVEIVSLLHEIRDVKPRLGTFPIRDSDRKTRDLVLNDLLASLYFRQEYDRFHDINSAHKGTFEWIFRDSPSAANKATWSNFDDWLRHHAGIYWISGKAGSGKSTLMKLLGTDKRSRAALLKWSVGSRLLILSFYFWSPGTPLQKSLEGLLRSIIAQALKACPELAEKIFPDRFEHRISDRHCPTMQQLTRAFASLTAPGLVDDSQVPIKLALFIDGLDEFDAGLMSHAELAAILTAAKNSSSFKAVLSSRPENAFEDAFVDCPNLRLHLLTHNDVVKYVNENLRAHPRMIQLESQAPDKTASLVEEIVGAAQGVFLWVRVVVRSLLEGLQNHDDIGTLVERLHELPTDLEDLFRLMLQRVPHRYKQAMSKIFQLLSSVSELDSNLQEQMLDTEIVPLTALGLKFAILESKEVMEAQIGQLTAEKAFQEIRSIDARLKTCCSGLVELRAPLEKAHYNPYLSSIMESTIALKNEADDWEDSELHFIHRSVKEYISKEDVWQEILQQTDHEGFHAGTAFLQSLVMQAKACSYEVNKCRSWNGLPWDLVATALRIARTLEEERGTDQLDMLNALETALTKRCGLDWWDTYQEDYIRPITWHDNFFSFAVRYGLRRYVQARLKIHGRQSIDKPGRPLLDYACRPKHSYDVWLRGRDFRVVEALLQHGADPNEKFNGFSPWQNAWHEAWYWHLTPELSRVLETLSAYGADPNAYIEDYKGFSERVTERSRLSVLLVALQVRARSSEDGAGNVKENAIGKETMSRIITQLKKKGAKVREWREVDGVFVRQKSGSWSERGKALQAQAQCVLL